MADRTTASSVSSCRTYEAVRRSPAARSAGPCRERRRGSPHQESGAGHDEVAAVAVGVGAVGVAAPHCCPQAVRARCTRPDPAPTRPGSPPAASGSTSRPKSQAVGDHVRRRRAAPCCRRRRTGPARRTTGRAPSFPGSRRWSPLCRRPLRRSRGCGTAAWSTRCSCPAPYRLVADVGVTGRRRERHPGAAVGERQVGRVGELQRRGQRRGRFRAGRPYRRQYGDVLHPRADVEPDPVAGRDVVRVDGDLQVGRAGRCGGQPAWPGVPAVPTAVTVATSIVLP